MNAISKVGYGCLASGSEAVCKKLMDHPWVLRSRTPIKKHSEKDYTKELRDVICLDLAIY